MQAESHSGGEPASPASCCDQRRWQRTRAAIARRPRPCPLPRSALRCVSWQHIVAGSSHLPAVRQQLPDLACALRGQPCQYILEVRVRIVPVEFCRADQAHHGGGPLASPQRPGEQPVRAANGNHWVILHMSGKKLKSSTAGIRCTDVALGANTASSEPAAK